MINKHKHLQHLHNATCHRKKKPTKYLLLIVFKSDDLILIKTTLKCFMLWSTFALALFNLERQLITIIIKYYYYNYLSLGEKKKMICAIAQPPNYHRLSAIDILSLYVYLLHFHSSNLSFSSNNRNKKKKPEIHRAN